MITLRGTDHSDSLAGHADESYLLQGLGGNDSYTLRLFDVTVPKPYGPSKVVYFRDKISETTHGGYDTARLVNYYNNVGFTGITPGGYFTAADLANVEHIIATTTKRGSALIGWTITTGSGDNLIDAPGSADTLSGGAGNDRIHAGGGNDAVRGDDGVDSLYGDAGDDILIGGKGNDLLSGGTGNDTASYAGGSSAVSIHLNTGFSTAHDHYASIESVIGTSHSDSLYGSAGNNTLSGGSGNDQLNGSIGNDVLYGGTGNDGLVGGSGNDAIHSGGGRDLMTGGTGNDQFVFDFSAKQVFKSGYVSYARTVAFQDTITDFEDGHDKIVIHQAHTDGRYGQSGPYLQDIEVRQSGADTIVYFGDPSHSSNEGSLHEIYYGSAVLKHFDADQFSTADILFA